MNWCILIPLIVGAICALLGYLLGRLLSAGNNNDKNRIAKLEADLDACRKSKINLESDLALANSSSANTGIISSFAAATAFDANAAKAIFGKKIKENDLTIVEGIGPKIQELFHNYDIKTWKALSECSIEKCQNVLDSGGERFRIHKPRTWPEQAKMAYEGRWEDLLKWQDELDGGK